MSKTLFLSLPRFDANGSLLPPADWLRSFEDAGSRRAPPAERAYAEPMQPSYAETVPAETPVARTTPGQCDLRKLEASLTQLNAALDKIERDAQAQTAKAVQSIAARLFPLLSKDFLAEEIGRHLSDLIPPLAALVEIRADVSLTDDLQAMLERNSALAGRCTVLSGAGEGRVDVSWKTGGLSFDFEGLLKACLSHLNSAHNMKKE
jgi:hypothetical protein